MAKMPSDRERIAAVEKIIRPHVRRTPVLEVSGADFRLDSTSLIFKLEFLQHAGSFKARGAFTHLLTREVPAAGVVAASGGNHGVAVSFAAGKLGIPAKIFVPTVASPEKIERIRAYGAQLVITGERYADALAASEAWVARSGAMPIHAYDQIETLLGQGTVGLEFEEQYPQLDTLLVAVGGGGLLGGVAAWYASKIKLIGVEPAAAPTLSNALRAGRPVDSGLRLQCLVPLRFTQASASEAVAQVHRVSRSARFLGLTVFPFVVSPPEGFAYRGPAKYVSFRAKRSKIPTLSEGTCFFPRSTANFHNEVFKCPFTKS